MARGRAAWHGTCDRGHTVDGLGNVALGIVGFCAGFILFLVLSGAAGSDSTAPARRCDPSAWPAWPAPSEAPPALPPADGTRPVAL